MVVLGHVIGRLKLVIANILPKKKQQKLSSMRPKQAGQDNGRSASFESASLVIAIVIVCNYNNSQRLRYRLSGWQ